MGHGDPTRARATLSPMLANSPAAPSRLTSLDVMRGLTVAAMLVVNNAGDFEHVHPWLDHAPWHGATPADFVFPFFLFIVGVSLALRTEAQLAAGTAPAVIRREALRRALRLVALGVVLEAAAWLTIREAEPLRFAGVLQRIGVTYLAGVFVTLNLRDARKQWLLIAAILIGYWLALRATGGFEPFVNFADRLDGAVLGRHAYLHELGTAAAHDPEGLLSTLPAVCSVLLGMRAADWLRAGRDGALAGAGLGLIVLGALWSLAFPLNKNLWTSSFVLVTGGAAMLTLALAHRAFDRAGWPAIGARLGRHAISVYVLGWLATLALAASGAADAIYENLFLPLAEHGAPLWLASLGYALAVTALIWGLIVWLDRRGWRYRI